MIGYATVGTNDLKLSTGFYDELLGLLGLARVYEFERGVFYGTQGFEFAVLTPADGKPAEVGNGHMVAFKAPTRAAVDAVYDTAIRLGGRCEGKPGMRSAEEDGFYGAYFRDIEGNKLCVYRIGPA